MTKTISKDCNIEHPVLIIFEGSGIKYYPEHCDFIKSLPDIQLLKTKFASKTNFLFCSTLIRETNLKKQLIALQAHGVELIFALRGGTGLSGLLLLGKRADGRSYTRRDIQFFTTIANQAGVALENALHYESLVKSKKQIEKMFTKVVKSEKMAALGEMSTVLAHELKNPLGIIRSSAQYLTKNLQNTKTGQELLEYIIGEVDGLESVINNMMGLARYKVPDLAPVNLCSKILSMINLWNNSGNHNKTISIQLVQKNNILSVFADFKQLQQVFLNCITNSEDAMPDGGRILFFIEYQSDDTIDIQISDTGPGVPEKNIKNVFKKFFTTKEKGMGIGLSVCKQIILAHNGSISIENMKNAGLNVRINLPCKPLETCNVCHNLNPDIKESFLA
jgi:signal transduction histidine kinase